MKAASPRAISRQETSTPRRHSCSAPVPRPTFDVAPHLVRPSRGSGAQGKCQKIAGDAPTKRGGELAADQGHVQGQGHVEDDLVVLVTCASGPVGPTVQNHVKSHKIDDGGARRVAGYSVISADVDLRAERYTVCARMTLSGIDSLHRGMMAGIKTRDHPRRMYIATRQVQCRENGRSPDCSGCIRARTAKREGFEQFRDILQTQRIYDERPRKSDAHRFRHEKTLHARRYRVVARGPVTGSDFRAHLASILSNIHSAWGCMLIDGSGWRRDLHGLDANGLLVVCLYGHPEKLVVVRVQTLQPRHDQMIACRRVSGFFDLHTSLGFVDPCLREGLRRGPVYCDVA